MDHFVAIHKLSEQLDLTSRTLRHWEAEGLITSQRDIDSGWRCYDSRNVFFIRVTALLRDFDISLKDIKKILNSGKCEMLENVIRQHLSELDETRLAFSSLEKRLRSLLQDLGSLGPELTEQNLEQILTGISSVNAGDAEKEKSNMLQEKIINPSVRFVTMPPMRAAYYIAISSSPEEEALKTIIDWIKVKRLEGTARLFGGDMPPYPSGEGRPYGYGVLASIPDNVEVAEPLKEMTVQGGLYAVMESSDDIGGSWNKLMDYLQTHEEYTPDSTRRCYEEHVRNDAPDGSGNEYFLRLMEPVKRK